MSQVSLTVLVIGMLVLAIHIVSPIYPLLGSALVGSGALLYLKDLPRRGREAACLMLVTLAGSSVFSGSSEHFDNQLYYIPTLKWLTESNLTWGLVNLHGRFAFNSLWHNLASISQVPWSQWSGPMSINTSLWAIFLSAGFLNQKTNLQSWSMWMRVALLLLPSLSIPYHLSTPSHDIACALFGLYYLERLKENPDRSHVLFALLASMIKMLALPLLIWELIRTRHKPRSKIAMGLGAMTLGLWLLTNIAQSGCAIYPFPASCLYALPWTPSREVLQAAADFVQYRALHPLGVSHGGWAYWVKNFASSPLGIVGVGAFLISLWLWRLKSARAHLALIYFLLVAWILGGPYPRMGFLALMALASLAAATLVGRRLVRVPAGRIFALSFGLWFVFYGKSFVGLNNHWPIISLPQVVRERTASQLVVLRPDGHIKCGATNIPCVPYFNPNLQHKTIGLWSVYTTLKEKSSL